MKTIAPKWGNSLAIRVPKRVAEEAGLREKDPVDIEVREGTLVVRPPLRHVYRLEDLLKRITPPQCTPRTRLWRASRSRGAVMSRRAYVPDRGDIVLGLTGLVMVIIWISARPRY